MANTMVQTGVGVVWGCAGFVAAGIVIAAQDLKQSVDFEQTADTKRFTDSNGNWVGTIFANNGQKYDITVVPSSTTIALALAKLVTYIPVLGAIVTITDTSPSLTTVPFSLMSVKETRTPTGEAAVQMTIERSTANDVTPIISAA